MSSDDRLVMDYMAMLHHLSNDLKLKLIAKLTDSIIESGPTPTEEKNESWRQLFGAWRDMDENLAAMIRENRFPGREIPSFD